jgi:dipeptidyl aminopeptidase/acylaminoacyl peptidase
MTTQTYVTPYVFVYDVFLKDAVKHVKIAPYLRSWSRASVPGKLYQLPTGLPLVVEEAGGTVFGEVMTFDHMDEVMALIDAQEGYRADQPQNSRLLREVREATLSPSGEKVQAYLYLFPKEKFNAKEMYAVHAHGGDWRKFVMMPRFDGYQH